MSQPSITDLTAFVAVAQHRSFRAAADAIGVSRSSLSHAMRGLEERLGVRLLHRTTRSRAHRSGATTPAATRADAARIG
jgi:DNA-binding transcriptional LysR family regulator